MFKLFANRTIMSQLLLMIFISIGTIVIVQIVYYSNISDAMEQQMHAYSDAMSAQIADDLASESQMIISAANSIIYDSSVQNFLQTDNHAERLELYPSINHTMGILGTAHKNIVNLTILQPNRSSMATSYSNTFYPNFHFRYKTAYLLELENQYHLFDEPFAKPIITPYEIVEGNYGVYSILIPIFTTDRVGIVKVEEILGVAVITLNTESIKDKMKIKKYVEGSNMLILDSEDCVVAAQDLSYSGERFEADDLTSLGLNYNVVEISQMNWKVVEIFPEHLTTPMLGTIRYFGIVITMIAVIVLGLMQMFIIRAMQNPINQIINFTKTAGEDYHNERLILSDKNEIGILGNYINAMLDQRNTMHRKIVATQSKLYEVELEQRTTVLNSLQSKINPHFLYNTLECIRGIALTHEIDEIVEITTSMANIFRYNIKGENIVPIASEIESVEDYISIINIRHGGRISARLSIPEDIKQLFTIKMILQPIVENAIFHGLEPKPGRGNITIQAECIGAGVLFTVSDDGVGIDSTVMDEINQKLTGQATQETNKGMGIVNIDRRLKLLGGEDYGVTIKSELGNGTDVMIFVPEISQQ